MYNGIICKLTNVTKHQNADKLNIATVSGNTVIVGLNNKEGELGIYFDTDGQLSEEFCVANNLLALFDESGKKIGGGFFGKKRRVLCQAFRGVKSHGFWIPVDSLSFTGYDVSALKEGDAISSLNGVPICNKYYTPKTLALRNKQGEKKSKKKVQQYPFFSKHEETEQWRHKVKHLLPGDMLYVTEKLHGTSGRYGNIPYTKDSWLRRLFGLKTVKHTHLMGSRNVIKQQVNNQGYYTDETFRWNVLKNNGLIGKLHKGETLFYEIVGYMTSGVPIMQRQKVGGFKEIAAKYGDTITYSYGIPDGGHEMYVYAITQSNEDGITRQLPWSQVKERCRELNIKYVPELGSFLVGHDGIPETLVPELDQSTLAPHMAEGVCIRVEHASGPIHFYKLKTFNFGLAEGYLKEDVNYVDTEEVS